MTREIKKTIRVCNCGVPLIWTFAFSGCERFCLNCGAKSGMFGTGDYIPATKELIFQKKLVDAIWDVIYSKKGFLPSCRFGKNGCKKDNKEGRYSSSCDDHRQHLTKAEIENDIIARKYLEKMKGLLSNPQE